MILVSELTCKSSQHSPFNAGLLSTVSLAYPQEKVIFCAEQNHLDEVYSLLSTEVSSRIEFYCLDVPELKTEYFKRIRQDYVNLKKCLGLLKNCEKSTLLFCNVKPSVLLALRAAYVTSRIRKYRLKVQIVLHANAKSLIG